ncbi:transcriptional regulator, GntR family [Actinobaculum suis]|uniref:Transcriptional regulator, GntR family n=1 Tax=Actinobaculum suis TaxID=1657 RepID=A0A7Z9CA72_9ACTO|nr:GntR family transcriptional regulator [Actinobaculum suis]VDG77185.1 transcriptional regulator, GntR family [Actinobaculum suis]
MASESLEKIDLQGENVALRDKVYDELLKLLIAGRFAPGDSLSIDGLSRVFGISQTPVREALVEVERTGLVRREARRGYRVAEQLTKKEVNDLVETRLLLEIPAAKKALNSEGPLIADLNEALKAHRETVDLMEKYGDDADLELILRYFDADWKFHEVILHHADNRYLEAAVNSLSFQVHRMRQAVGSGVSDGRYAVKEHARIVKAFESGNESAVADAMCTHLQNVLLRSEHDAEIIDEEE